MKFCILFVCCLALASARGPKGGGGPSGGPTAPPTTTTTTTTTTAGGKAPPPDGGTGGGDDTGSTDSECDTRDADPSGCSASTVADASGITPLGSALASLSSGSLSSNGNCGDDARGYFEEYVEGGYRYILISGAPNHVAECGQANPNPNVRCEIWQWIKADEVWADTGSMYTAMGTIGFVKSGTVVYDPRSSPFGDLASCNEWSSLDPSYGHSSQDTQYHYHAAPTDYSSATDSSACEHIGYMLDGGKLYGLCEENGVEMKACYQLADGVTEATNESDYDYIESADCHLDECNMAVVNGEMAYVLSSNWPYVPRCLRGNVASINGYNA